MLDVSDVYERYVDRIFAFFAYRLSGTGDAEDLTALTFERVVRHADRYDPRRAQVATWIFTIAERVLIDHFRRAGRRDEQPWADDAGDHQALVTVDTPSEGLSPELQSALAALSDRERQVIGLRFGGDLSAREIGALVDASEANVHQILSRALRRLRGQLEGATPVR